MTTTKYQISIPKDTADHVKEYGFGSLSKGILRLWDDHATNTKTAAPVESAMERRDRAKAEKKAQEEADKLASVRQWIRDNGHPPIFGDEYTKGLTQEMIAEDIAAFEAWVAELKAAEEAKKAQPPKEIWTDATEARWNEAIATGMVTEEQKIAKRAGYIDGRTTPAKVLTYAEQLAANPWPADEDEDITTGI